MVQVILQLDSFLSSGLDNPQCCGATAWHDHQDAAYAYNTEPSHSYGNWVGHCLLGYQTPYPQGAESYPETGDALQIKVYDPRRNIVVTASAYQVNIDGVGEHGHIASVGSKIQLTYNGDQIIESFVTGAQSPIKTSGTPRGGVCIKMES